MVYAPVLLLMAGSELEITVINIYDNLFLVTELAEFSSQNFRIQRSTQQSGVLKSGLKGKNLLDTMY